MIQRMFILFAIRIILISSAFDALISTSSAADLEDNKCIGNWYDLQQAIDDLPIGGNNGGNTPEIFLCPTLLEIPHTIQIIERSLRIGCAVTNTDNDDDYDGNNTRTKKCILKRSPQQEETYNERARLLEILGGVTANGHATNTVELSNIRLEGGEYYNDDDGDDDDDIVQDNVKDGGAAIMAEGANLIILGCHLEGNIASTGGGAIAVHDLGRPILLVITDTTFNENMSIEDDCHSLYWRQDHGKSTAELTTISKISSSTATAARQLILQENAWLDQWDDPAQATRAVGNYQPGAGAVLCF